MIKHLNEKQKLKALAGLLKENEVSQASRSNQSSYEDESGDNPFSFSSGIDSGLSEDAREEIAMLTTEEFAEVIKDYIENLGRGNIPPAGKGALKKIQYSGLSLYKALNNLEDRLTNQGG